MHLHTLGTVCMQQCQQGMHLSARYIFSALLHMTSLLHSISQSLHTKSDMMPGTAETPLVSRCFSVRVRHRLCGDWKGLAGR